MSVDNLKFDFVDENSPVLKVIKQVLGALLPAESAESVTIFMIHGSPMSNDMHNWEPRLAQALRTYTVKDPLVLIGLIRPDQGKLVESSAFQVLLARPRVRYVDVINNFLPGVVNALNEVRAAAAVSLTPIQQVRELAARISQAEIGVIKHDLKYAPPGSEREQQLMDRARAAGLVGKNEELRAALEQCATIPTELVCCGQRFAGLFCDVEGTLLKADGSVNEHVFGLLTGAEAAGRTVTVWTGGDPAALTQRLQDVGLAYEVVRKSDFAGAVVEEAVDDNLDGLRQQYSITVEIGHAP